LGKKRSRWLRITSGKVWVWISTIMAVVVVLVGFIRYAEEEAAFSP
jgi:hypothetical protein